jgi:hypothetical protein
MIAVPTSTVVPSATRIAVTVPAKGRELDKRLRSLNLHEHLVYRDLVAGLDLPRHDLGLGEAFSHIRECEF